MPTGIRFPLPQPGSIADTYDETRSSVDMEAGPARVRNKMRTAPRVFDVQWLMSQSAYETFDRWWQFTIKGAEREFDVQLLDDDETLVWYTARWIGEYSASINSERYEWTVSGKLRALGDSFLVRPSGTDELQGRASVGMTARGELRAVGVRLYGRASVGISAIARLDSLPFYGSASVGISARGSLGIVISRELREDGGDELREDGDIELRE